MAIVACRPRPGQDDGLPALTREHVPAPRALGLATDRPTLAMRAANGTIVEVFEPTDDGIARAHDHTEMQAMWARYAEMCDNAPLTPAWPKPAHCSPNSPRSTFSDGPRHATNR